MMKFQKEMFNGLQETMKLQLEIFMKTMQQLTAGLPKSQTNQAENKLAAQPEANLKQCGAIYFHK